MIELPKRQIVHMHSHTEYSLLDGIKNSVEFLKAAKAKGMDAYAITEHGNMASSMGFYMEAIKPEVGIKPILGLEAYVVDDASKKDKEAKSSHLVLIARTNDGLHNLLRISNFSWNEGFYYKPKVDFAHLKKYKKGITALTACMGGVVSNAIRFGGMDVAEERVTQLKDIYGDNLFLEMQLMEEVYGPDLERVTRKVKMIKDDSTRHEKLEYLEQNSGEFIELLTRHVENMKIQPDYEEKMKGLLGDSWVDQATVNKYMYLLSKKTKTPYVLTGDCHYPLKGDHKLQDLVIRIGFGNYKKAREGEDQKSQSTGRGYYSSQLYVKDNNDFERARKRWHPYMPRRVLVEAINATHKIADKVKTSIPIGQHNLPTFPIETHHLHKNGDTKEKLFARLIEKGFQRIVVPKIRKDEIDAYRARLKFEIDTIKQAHFVDYFLIIEDIVGWSRRNGIHCVARGSVAGSLVAYTLDITGINPIPYNLLFERFLNPARVSGERAKSADALPDIDMDFERNGRPRVKAYIVQKYGRNRVLTIGSYGTMGVRMLVKDFARALDYKIGGKVYEYTDINKITANLGPTVKTIEEACEDSEVFAAFYEENKGWFETYVRPLIGNIRNMSRHAAGVIITPTDFTEWVPIRTQALDDEDGEEGKVVISQWEDVYCERRGLLKLDVLGVKQLDVLHRSLDLIERNHDVKVDLDNIDLNDKKVFAKFHEGDNFGVFQFNSNTQIGYTRSMKPNSVEDLCASNALIRPGPMKEGAHEDFVKLRKGEMEPTYDHECIIPFLKETYGLMVYQEQCMQVAHVLGGMSLAEADMLRSAMKKKDEKIMQPFYEKFISGCKAHGLTGKHGDSVWRKIIAFSSYAFNKCLTGDTILHRGGAGGHAKDPKIAIEDLYDAQNSKTDWGYKIRSGKLSLLQMHDDGRIRRGMLKAIYYNGKKRVYEITTESGKVIKATKLHKFLTSKGYVEVKNLKIGTKLMTMGELNKYQKVGFQNDRSKGKTYTGTGSRGFGVAHGEKNPAFIDGRQISLNRAMRISLKRSQGKCEFCGFHTDNPEPHTFEYAHINDLENFNGNFRKYNHSKNIKYLCNSCHKKLDHKKGERNIRFTHGYSVVEDKIVSIKELGLEKTYDIEMIGPEHNFIANGIVSHNSHSATYALMGYHCQWLKTYFPNEFIAATMEFADDSLDKNENIYSHRYHCIAEGIEVINPDINGASVNFDIKRNGGIMWPLRAIKGVGGKASAIIQLARKNGKFTSMDDFMGRIEKRVVNKRVMVKLIAADAFRAFGKQEEIMRQYFVIKKEKKGYPEELEGLSDIDWQKLKDKTIGYISEPYKKTFADQFSKHVMSSQDYNNTKVNSRVCIGGLVTKMKAHKARNGEMGFLTIEDMGEKHEVVIFASVWGTLKVKPFAGHIVEIRGDKKVDNRGGGNNIVLGNPGHDKVFIIST